MNRALSPPPPTPDLSLSWEWLLSLLHHPAFHQGSWGHIPGSSNQQYYYCKDNYYLLSTHVCQAFCLHYLNPPHNPVKLPASWCGLWFSPFLEYLLVLSRTRASAWRGLTYSSLRGGTLASCRALWGEAGRSVRGPCLPSSSLRGSE